MAEETSPSINNEKVTLQENEADTMKELKKEREKASECLNRIRYLQADFENYKKRAKRELDETIQYGNRRLILELLTIVDELECAVAASRDSTDKAFLEGIEMTLNKLFSILKKEGVSKIETMGECFDPNKHEAVLRVQTEGKDGVILEEIRKGYMFRNMVIRPSLVKVAVNISKKGENE